MDMAIIPTVLPIPVRSRSGRRPRELALPRMIPPWSAYRKRITSAPWMSARSMALM
jgi:hypothetical protein